MSGAYAFLLGVEGAVVLASGGVITVTASRNPDVLLYARVVTHVGLGIALGGVATLLIAADLPDVASTVVVAAALAFLAAGWRLSGDCIRECPDAGVVELESDAAQGFEE